MAVRRPRGWLGPAILAAIIVFVVFKRQHLLKSSLSSADGAAELPAAPPRTHWSSADLGVFPYHIPGEVRFSVAAACSLLSVGF